MAHKLEWKENSLKELTSLAEKYPVVAIANLKSFPCSLFQKLRKDFAGKGVIRVSKTRVLKRALEEAKKDYAPLLEFVSDSCAVIFTDLNSFELMSFLKKNKGRVAAKAGAIAPEDIVVPEGDTGLPPGPALSDLKQAGLKPKLAGATIEIPEDTVVTKAGAVVTEPVARVLVKLGILPLRVGLNLVASFEEGEILKAEVLDIDLEKKYAEFVGAARDSLALSVAVVYPVKENAEALLAKAFREAKAVALESNFLTEETLKEVLAKAEAQAKALGKKVGE